MRAVMTCFLVLLLFQSFGQEQLPPRDRDRDDAPVRLPNGKLQAEEILKSQFEKSREDAARMVELASEIKADLDKGSAFVVSVGTIKKTEEIEKLAKRIRGRMKQ